MVPREFGVLNGLAKYLSDSLNSDDVLIQRLSSGLQDCAVHTQPFWSSLTHRTRKERGEQRDGAERGGREGSLH